MANTPAVVGLQIEPPLLDASYTPSESPLSVIGNSPNADMIGPSGSLGASYRPFTTVSGTAFTTNTGPAGDTNSGINFQIIGVAGTFHGLQPNFGFVQRYLASVSGTKFSQTPVNLQMLRFEMFGVRFATVPSGTQCRRDNILTFITGGAAGGPIFDTTRSITKNGR